MTNFIYEDDFEKAVFEYLDRLRESGETNMWGAVPYIQEEFDIYKGEAGDLHTKWMKTFGERHNA